MKFVGKLQVLLLLPWRRREHLPPKPAVFITQTHNNTRNTILSSPRWRPRITILYNLYCTCFQNVSCSNCCSEQWGLRCTIHFYSKINKTHQCLKFILFWDDTTCFGRSFRPSSAVQDCTYSNRHLSNRYCCVHASGYPLASRQQYLFESCMYSLELRMMGGKTVRNM